jgi:hypothetical protein
VLIFESEAEGVRVKGDPVHRVAVLEVRGEEVAVLAGADLPRLAAGLLGWLGHYAPELLTATPAELARYLERRKTDGTSAGA